MRKVRSEQVWSCSSFPESRGWVGIWAPFTDRWERGTHGVGMAVGVCVLKLLGCDAEVNISTRHGEMKLLLRERALNQW